MHSFENPSQSRHKRSVAKAKKSNDDRLRAYPAGNLAKNPDLLKSLGIDIQDYEDKVAGR